MTKLRAHELRKPPAKKFCESTRMTTGYERCYGQSNATLAGCSHLRDNGLRDACAPSTSITMPQIVFSIARTRSGRVSLCPTHYMRLRAGCLLGAPGWLGSEVRLPR